MPVKRGHIITHLGADSLDWEAVQAEQLCGKHIFSGHKNGTNKFYVNYCHKTIKTTQSYQIDTLTKVSFQSSADNMKEFNVTGEVMICENRYFSPFPVFSRNAGLKF